MAISSKFNPNAGILTTFGDALDNVITVSRDAAGKLLVNGGAVSVLGGTPTVVNTSRIDVYGLGGDDTITLNESEWSAAASPTFSVAPATTP